MPSKQGFGNNRKTSPTMKYGSAIHYKNPVKLTPGAKEKIMASDANPKFKAAISKQSTMQKHAPLKDGPPSNKINKRDRSRYDEVKAKPGY